MKTCPVCKARCFDDMEICYGCMHRFEEGEGSGAQEAGKPARHEARQVFGAVPDDESRPHGGTGPAEDAEGARPDQEGLPPLDAAGRQPSREVRHAADSDEATGPGEPDVISEIGVLEPVLGPIASAVLGNGYRLVLSIERA